jgi:hypothetical protein
MQRVTGILVALGFMSLGSSSQAAISFGGWPSGSLPSDISIVNSSELLVQNPNLQSDKDAGSVSYTERFSVTESGSTLIHADVKNVVGSISDGSLTLTAYVFPSAGANATQIYDSTTTNFHLDGTTTKLSTSGGTTINLGPGTYQVLYTASYTGFDNGITFGSIPSFNIAFTDPAVSSSNTPEPSSFALFAMAVTGLGVARWHKRKQVA